LLLPQHVLQHYVCVDFIRRHAETAGQLVGHLLIGRHTLLGDKRCDTIVFAQYLVEA
jgi:hypothetical protein